VERVGAQFREVREFQRIPGVGPMAAHVFSAIIEEPARFANKHKLWKYSQLGITDRSSDNKPLGYPDGSEQPVKSGGIEGLGNHR
jgi:transposase